MKSNKIYQMELEFYEFAKTQFDTVWKRLFDKNKNFLMNQFHYEKIKP